MTDEEDEFDAARAQLHNRAIGRWENEGGAGEGASHTRHAQPETGRDAHRGSAADAAERAFPCRPEADGAC